MKIDVSRVYIGAGKFGTGTECVIAQSMGRPTRREQFACTIDPGVRVRKGAIGPRMSHVFHPSTRSLQHLLKVVGGPVFFPSEFVGSILDRLNDRWLADKF